LLKVDSLNKALRIKAISSSN